MKCMGHAINILERGFYDMPGDSVVGLNMGFGDFKRFTYFDG